MNFITRNRCLFLLSLLLLPFPMISSSDSSNLVEAPKISYKGLESEFGEVSPSFFDTGLPIRSEQAYMTVTLSSPVLLTDHLDQLRIQLTNFDQKSHQFQVIFVTPKLFTVSTENGEVLTGETLDERGIRYTLDPLQLIPDEGLGYLFNLNVTNVLPPGVEASMYPISVDLLLDDKPGETYKFSLLVARSRAQTRITRQESYLLDAEYQLNPTIADLSQSATFRIRLKNPYADSNTYEVRLIDETFGQLNLNLESGNEIVPMQGINESSGIVYTPTPIEGLELASNSIKVYQILIHPKEFWSPYTKYSMRLELLKENQIIYDTKLYIDTIGASQEIITISNLFVQSDGELLRISFRLLFNEEFVDPDLVITHIKLEGFNELIPCTYRQERFVGIFDSSRNSISSPIRFELLTIYDPGLGFWASRSLIIGLRSEMVQFFDYTLKFNQQLNIPTELFLTEGDIFTLDISIHYGNAPLSGVFALAQFRYQFPPDQRPTGAYDSNVQGWEVSEGEYQITVDTDGFQGGDYTVVLSLYKTGFQRSGQLLFVLHLEPSLLSKIIHFSSITIQVIIVLLIVYGAFKIIFSGLPE